MKTRIVYSVFFILIISSCGRPLPTLENVDLKQWGDDRNGCSGLRSKMIDAIRLQKAKLLGLNEQQVITLLSRPDQNELYKRNQKFYYYFLQPSQACSSDHSEHALQFVIRFNAMGIAKETSIE